MYVRNVSPFKILEPLTNTYVRFGVETEETIYHPNSQQLRQSSAPPPVIQALGLPQFKTKTFTNFLQI